MLSFRMRISLGLNPTSHLENIFLTLTKISRKQLKETSVSNTISHNGTFLINNSAQDSPDISLVKAKFRISP